MAKSTATLLYIEEYKPLSKVVVDYFQSRSIDAIGMDDMFQAIRKIDKIKPDLILLSDQIHPKKEGDFISLLQEKKPKYLDIPIIYLYSREEQFTQPNFITETIEKPFALEELFQHVSLILSRGKTK